ncbi:hypothetical protein B0T13DRAFT_496119 [Neurospora crassa]|nr:hypothetical protein B0T13DRAFT_496119 [Neurospora crassa]
MTHHLMICPPASATRVHRPLTSAFPVASASLLFREYLPTYTARSSRVHHHHNMAFYMSTHLPDSAAHARTHARTHAQPTGRWLLQVKSLRRTIALLPPTCPPSISYISIASSHPTLQVLASLQARQG